MPSYIDEVEIPIYADSRFGTNQSSSGAEFSIVMSPALEIPRNAHSIQFECTEATIWNTAHNVTSSGTLEMEIENSASGTVAISGAYPPGAYDVSGVLQQLNLIMEEAGVEPTYPMFMVDEYEYTQKLALGWYMDSSGSQLTIDFSGSPFATLLGYSETDVTFGGTSASGEYSYTLASNSADFSTYEYYQIQSDLGGGAIGPNGDQSQTIAVVMIDVSLGNQIHYRPTNPLPNPNNSLAGSRIKSVRFRLLDGSGSAVDLGGETWSARFRLKYKTLVTIEE